MLPTIQELTKILTFKTSRSGGKGGQHVNKVSSKVEVLFKLDEATFLTAEEKQRISEKLGSRLDNEQTLHVVAQDDRSQYINKQRAIFKLHELLTDALKVQKVRKATKIPKAVKEKRLRDKAKLAEKKENRRVMNY